MAAAKPTQVDTPLDEEFTEVAENYAKVDLAMVTAREEIETKKKQYAQLKASHEALTKTLLKSVSSDSPRRAHASETGKIVVVEYSARGGGRVHVL